MGERTHARRTGQLRRRRADEDTSHGQDGPEHRHDVATAVLQMQRSVGNLAVQRLIASARSKSAEEGDERHKMVARLVDVSTVRHTGPSDAQSEVEDRSRAKASTSVRGGATASQGLNPEDYGLTFEESVDVSIGAKFDKANDTWSPTVKKLAGHYSQQVRLLAGQREVTGPGGNTTKANHCDQASELDALGNTLPHVWYMLRAVKDHEDVHAAHFKPGLKNAEPAITTAIEAVSIPNTPKMKKAAALVAIKGDGAYQTEEANAKALWVAEDDVLIAGDHGGPTDVAEHKVVDPMVKSICKHAKGKKWPACGTCP